MNAQDGADSLTTTSINTDGIDDSYIQSIASSESDDGEETSHREQVNIVKTVIFQLPPPIQTKTKTRARQKRTRTQVQRILGWYPTEEIESMLAREQASIDEQKRARELEKANQIQKLVRFQNRKRDTLEQESNPTQRNSTDTTRSIASMPFTPGQQTQFLDISYLQNQVAFTEAKLAQLERREISSSTSTIEYSLSSSPSGFNFAPTPQSLPTLTSEPPSSLDVDRPVKWTRTLSKSLASLYEQVNAVPANEDCYTDTQERNEYLSKYRYQMRAIVCATKIQSAWRMHCSRVVYKRWKKRKLSKQNDIWRIWTMVNKVDKLFRAKLCRRTFTEWAEEVQCNIKLRSIELRLLQHSSSLCTLPSIVKNLFLTKVREDEQLEGPQSLARRNKTNKTLYVDQAYAGVEDRSGDRSCNRIYELRFEMERARQAVARKFVQTTFLQWKAVHEAHSRVVVNAEMCLRRAFRMAFMKRPAWVGERVLVVFHMWNRYTVFKRHKLQCMEVPIFTTPLTQWDQWLRSYRNQQIRMLEAEAKGPLAWLRRYFTLFKRYLWHRRHRKDAVEIAKRHYSRQMLSGLFDSWHQDTVSHLETRRRLKQVFQGWHFYTLRRQHCRPQKRKVSIKSKHVSVSRAWSSWKEVIARHEMTRLDRLSKLLEIYPKLCQCLFLWADLTSQRVKSFSFQRWKSSFYRRKNFAKLWCTSTALQGRAVLNHIFQAWRGLYHPPAQELSTSFSLDPNEIAVAMERAMPYMYARNLPVEVDPYILHAFNTAVREGNLADMKAMFESEPLVIHGREPVYGNTALHVAVQSVKKKEGWSRQVLSYLLSHGASPFAMNQHGTSVLLSTSDIALRSFLLSNGYGFHTANAPRRIDLLDANTRAIWHTLVAMQIQVDSGSRAIGNSRLGGWHSFIPTEKSTHVLKPLRAPFLYVMANKLLHHGKVQAVEKQVKAMVDATKETIQLRLRYDRTIVADECIYDWMYCSETTSSEMIHPGTTGIAPFHAAHYFGKERSMHLETQLSNEFIHRLLGKPVRLKPVQDEVKELDALVLATEKQLLQLEDHVKRQETGLPSGSKNFGSITEEIVHVEHERIWNELRIALKLADPSVAALSREEEVVAKGMHCMKESEIIQKLEGMIQYEEKAFNTIHGVVEAASIELKRHEEEYEAFLEAYSGEDDFDGMKYSKLVTSRLQHDETKLHWEGLDKKLKKKRAKVDGIQQIHDLFASAFNEQRTYTMEEYSTLSSLLQLSSMTFSQLAQHRVELESRFKELDQNSLEQPDKENSIRSQRKQIRTVAKHLLIQHQVLSHMRRGSMALLHLKQVREESDPLQLQNDTLLTPSSNISHVSTGIRSTLHSKAEETTTVSLEVASALGKAYRKSMRLLFQVERQLISEEAESHRIAELQSYESFIEVNPLTGKVDPPPTNVDTTHLTTGNATAKDVTRLDLTRRSTLIVQPSSLLKLSEEVDQMPQTNRKREEILRAISRGLATSEASPFEEESPDLFINDRDESRRHIWGAQYEFANFAATASSDELLHERMTSSRTSQDAVLIEHGGPMAIWKADDQCQSEPASSFTFVMNKISEKHVTKERKENPTKPPPSHESNTIPQLVHSPPRMSARSRHSFNEISPLSERGDATHRLRRNSTDNSILSLLPGSPTLLTTPLVHTPRYVENDTSTPPVSLGNISNPEGSSIRTTSQIVDCESQDNYLVVSVESNDSISDDMTILPDQDMRNAVPFVIEEAMEPMISVVLQVPGDEPSKVMSPPVVVTTKPSSFDPLDDVDMLLDNYSQFSQTILRQFTDDTMIPPLNPPPPSIPPSIISSNGIHIRSMDELLQRDDSFRVAGRAKRKQKYPKRTASKLPAITEPASLMLDGTSMLRSSQSMPQLRHPAPRYIPQPEIVPVSNQHQHDGVYSVPRQTIQLYDDSPMTKVDSTGHLQFQSTTKLEDRPFHSQYVAPSHSTPHLPSDLELQGVGVLSDQSSSAPPLHSAMEAAVQGGRLNNQQRRSVWHTFTEKPLPDAVKQAYAAIYPTTYETPDSPPRIRQHNVISIDKTQTTTANLVTGLNVQKNPVAKLHGGKSNEVSFWQAVEGFKSIQDEAMKGTAFHLPPAKIRRGRRCTEIFQSYLQTGGSHELVWLVRDYPHVIETITKQITLASNGTDSTLFDKAQHIVEERMRRRRQRSSTQPNS